MGIEITILSLGIAVIAAVFAWAIDSITIEDDRDD